jgi:hypothetical protein
MNRRSQGSVQRQEDIDHRMVELKKIIPQRLRELENLYDIVYDLQRQVNNYRSAMQSPSITWPISYEIPVRPNVAEVLLSNDTDQMENLLASIEKEITYLEIKKKSLQQDKERWDAHLMKIDEQKQMEKEKEMKREDGKGTAKEFFSNLFMHLIFIGMCGLILLILGVAVVAIVYNKYDICPVIMNRMLVGLLIDTCTLFLLGFIWDVLLEK